MLLHPMMLIKIALPLVLCPLKVVFGVLNYSLDVLSKVSCIRHPTLITYNDINQQPNLLPIYQLKWRLACALSHS